MDLNLHGQITERSERQVNQPRWRGGCIVVLPPALHAVIGLLIVRSRTFPQKRTAVETEMGGWRRWLTENPIPVTCGAGILVYAF